MSVEAQERLLNGVVLILGVSLAGAVAAQYLAQSGIGRIILLDENPKALSQVYRKIADSPDYNPDTELVCRASHFNAENAEAVLSQCDVAIDGLDNWQDKLVASDTCMHIKKPLIHAGGSGFRFQLFTMYPGRSACLRCAFPQAGIDDVPLLPPDGGNIAAVIAMVGAWQALETIKYIAKIGVSQGNELIKTDWLSGESEIIRGLDPRPDCPDCKRVTRS